jgi:ribosomal peptide maturation radical SAM protein 1
MSCDVILISMPFTTPSMPSIAIGTLKACLTRAGIASECRYFNIAFVDYLAEQPANGSASPLGYDEFDRVLRLYVPTVGDWVFCVAPFRDDDAAVDERFERYLRSREISEEEIDLARRMRRRAPAFLERCCDDVLAAKPRLVAFSTMFSQNLASLTLAKMLKAADPTLKIVFGGANCDGSMGPALHRSFPWIDVVVRGEGERAIVELARDVQAGRPFRPLPGLCIRDGADVITTATPDLVAMDDVPAPDYDEYFTALERSKTMQHLTVTLLFESSRGCWWGEKSHCTFCGLNGSSLKYRSKSPDRVFDEITSLARRHQQLGFWAVDNIIDMDYFRTLLPRLRDAGYDIKIFFETKANLKREHLRMMRDSGITLFQPGIESFSTPILKLMRKGVTGLQNIRLLKWCREYGLEVAYHVLAGFPLEPPDEYDRMATIMPALSHLQPPDRLNKLHIDRFSPLHSTPGELGLAIEGPLDQYRILYPVDDATASELAYYFTPRYLDGRDPEAYVSTCREAIVAWNRGYRRHVPHSTLHYRRGPGFVVVEDERTPGELVRFKFADWQATVFLACDAGTTPAKMLEAVHATGDTEISLDDVQELCDALVAERLAYTEDGRYLTLPVAENPDAADRARTAPTAEPAATPGLVSIGVRRGVRAGAI